MRKMQLVLLTPLQGRVELGGEGCKTSWWITFMSPGRPTRLPGKVHFMAMSFLCHRRIVSEVTIEHVTFHSESATMVVSQAKSLLTPLSAATNFSSSKVDLGTL